MNNEEFAKYLGEQITSFEDEMSYAHKKINEEQYQKFYNVTKFFENYIQKFEQGKIVDFRMKPNEISCGLTAEFVLLDIWGDNLKEFIKALEGCSAISFEATLDGKVCVSLTVPDVFEVLD